MFWIIISLGIINLGTSLFVLGALSFLGRLCSAEYKDMKTSVDTLSDQVKKLSTVDSKFDTLIDQMQ